MPDSFTIDPDVAMPAAEQARVFHGLGDLYLRRAMALTEQWEG